MFDNLLTNRYFCIAIIIALLIVLYLYSQQKSCGVEGMQNIDLTPLAQELTETPWTNDPEGGNYKKYDNKFDKFADMYTKEKLKKNGYKYTNFLESEGERYIQYAKKDKDDEILKYMEGIKRMNSALPKPTESKGSKQCQPYKYPKSKLISDDESDSEMSDYDKYKEKIYQQMGKMMKELEKMDKYKKKKYH